MKLPFRKFFRQPAWGTEGGATRRIYSTYEDYIDHQKSKLSGIRNLEKKRRVLIDGLRERLDGNSSILRGTSVLCLGARLGAECEAFIEKGAFAVGIDLNPGQDNRFVVTGDFHRLQYADGSIDCVYTNCLDHVYELALVIAEVKRVLKSQGVFLVDIVKGTKDPGGLEPGKFESLWWQTNDTIIKEIVNLGFVVESRREFSAPWNGAHVVFRRTDT